VWKSQWTNRLLFVHGVSSEATLDDLGPLFPGAEEIVVVKDAAMTYPQVGKRKETAAIVHKYDG